MRCKETVLFVHDDFPFAHFSKYLSVSWHWCQSDPSPVRCLYQLPSILSLVFGEVEPKIRSVNKQYLANALQKSTYPFLPKSSKKFYQSDNAMEQAFTHQAVLFLTCLWVTGVGVSGLSSGGWVQLDLIVCSEWVLDLFCLSWVMVTLKHAEQDYLNTPTSLLVLTIT